MHGGFTCTYIYYTAVFLFVTHNTANAIFSKIRTELKVEFEYRFLFFCSQLSICEPLNLILNIIMKHKILLIDMAKYYNVEI